MSTSDEVMTVEDAVKITIAVDEIKSLIDLRGKYINKKFASHLKDQLDGLARLSTEISTRHNHPYTG